MRTMTFGTALSVALLGSATPSDALSLACAGVATECQVYMQRAESEWQRKSTLRTPEAIDPSDDKASGEAGAQLGILFFNSVIAGPGKRLPLSSGTVLPDTIKNLGSGQRLPEAFSNAAQDNAGLANAEQSTEASEQNAATESASATEAAQPSAEAMGEAAEDPRGVSDAGPSVGSDEMGMDIPDAGWGGGGGWEGLDAPNWGPAPFGGPGPGGGGRGGASPLDDWLQDTQLMS